MKHKKVVKKQIGTGLFLIGILGLLLWWLIPEPSSDDRVVYTLSWSALFALPLFLGIHSMLFKRYGDEDFIKGYSALRDAPFHRAYLGNTVEQTAINVLTAITLGMLVPSALLKLVPIQAIIYLIGRTVFFVTYKSDPMRRFVGFVMGYYVAVISLFTSTFYLAAAHV